MDFFTNQKLPVVAADCVVFMEEGVLLIRRRDEPGKGRLTAPRGMMEIDETVEEACKREMLEETGLKVDGLELVGVFSDPNRDQRGDRVANAADRRPRKRHLAHRRPLGW